MGLMIGAAVPSVAVGQIVSSLIIVVMLLFGGTLLNVDSVSPAIGWYFFCYYGLLLLGCHLKLMHFRLQYLSVLGYTMKALAQNEFTGLKFECFPGQTSCTSTGEQVLENFSFGSIPLWDCVLINVGFSFAFIILGYFFFSRTSAPSIRLK
jgi:hypothetical protein